MRSAYLVGSFDLFNISDLDVIAQARSLCDRLVVGVLSDSDATAYDGVDPVVPLDERLALVKHVRSVDDAVLHHADTIPSADLLLAVGGDLGGTARPLFARRRSVSRFLPSHLSGVTADSFAVPFEHADVA